MARKLDVALREDGSALYTTVAGDMVDHIAWRHYGTEFGTTEAILAANPNLAELGLALPAGIVVLLPARAMPLPMVARRKLWE